MKCPLCSTEAGRAQECPSCGAIFSKLRERNEREKKEAAEALAKIAAQESPAKFNPWIGRLAAVLVVLFWTIGFAFYYRNHYSIARKPRIEGPFVPPPERTAGFVRDPDGNLKPIQIIKANSAPARPGEKAPPAHSGSGPAPEGVPHDPDFDD